MKPRILFAARLSFPFTAAFVALLATPSALAATVFWSGNGSTPGGTGNWDTTTARWGTAAAGPYTSLWNNAANDIAEFNTTTGTATLGSNITLGGINAKTGAGGVAIASGAGPFKITLGFTNTIFSNAASTTVGRNLAVNAEVTGSNNLLIAGPSAALAPSGTTTLGAINTFTGTLAVSRTTLAIGASGQLNSGNYANTISIGTNGAFAYNSGLNQTLSGLISGTGNLSKGTSTASTLTLSNNNTGFTGATTVTAGTLAIASTGAINNSSGVTVNGGTFRYNSSTNLAPAVTFTSGTIAGTNWNGTLAGQTIGTGKTIAPGNSPGTAITVGQTWANGGSYAWEINNATGTAGSDPGWDLVNGTGTLNITAASGSQFNILVNSLTVGNIGGLATNFNDALSYNWLIADFNAITGFAANAFNIDTSAFTNPFTGTFGVSLGGAGVVPGDNSQIYLTYTIPEPNAALLGGLGLLALLRRRR